MADASTHQAQLQEQVIRAARQRQMQILNARYQLESNPNNPSPTQPLVMAMNTAVTGLPIEHPDDLGFIGEKPAYYLSYESACRNGPLSTVQAIVSSEHRTPVFLHNGLILTLSTGNVEAARYLISAGAPIIGKTAKHILSAPPDKQIPLFELLFQSAWTPNIPGDYGAVLLPRVVANHALLRWFLAHGANPNLGEQRYTGQRTGGPDTDSCRALEAAAGAGDVEAVRMLLDAGAQIINGVPLHRAAGAVPPGKNIYNDKITPSKEFDTSRIPVMEFLIERGADVNQMDKSRYMVPRYAIVRAVMAGAVERAKWLMEHGADPELGGPAMSAVRCALQRKNKEIIDVVAPGKEVDSLS